MISQLLNFLNQNSVATADSSSDATNSLDESTGSETIDTSFDHLGFPFASVAQGFTGFEKFKNSVADLVSPPPFHDPAGAVGFAFAGASWAGDQSPATLICASAD